MLGPDGPAGRSSQAASDSDAAARQQTQIEYIASSNPRLMAMAVVRGSWLVKAYHYTRIGCDRILQRAAQGSLYRGAGRQSRSERLKVGPYAQGRWPCIFFAVRRTAAYSRVIFHRLVAMP